MDGVIEVPANNNIVVHELESGDKGDQVSDEGCSGMDVVISSGIQV